MSDREEKMDALREKKMQNGTIVQEALQLESENEDDNEKQRRKEKLYDCMKKTE